jgi:hypothetical protein
VKNSTFAFALIGLLGAGPAFAQDPVPSQAPAPAAAPALSGQNGQLTVYYNPAGSDLQAPSLTGAPSMKNDGHYGGAFGDTLLVGRLGVMGGVLFGSSNTIEGGADFGSPTFNATTHEVARIIDVAGTFALVKSRAARVDATAGYFYLHAKPEISPANSYGGPSLGFAMKYFFANRFDLHGNLSLVPTYFVHGYVKDALREQSITQYRIGANYAVTDQLGLSAGYQGFKLNAKVTFDGQDAVVTLRGLYFGGQARW